MKFIEYLQEEYIATITGKHSTKYSGTSPIFCNPDNKEMRELQSNIRFIVNFITKKLYVWDWDVVHYEAARSLYKEKLIPCSNLFADEFWNSCFAGIGVKDGQKIHYTNASDYAYSINHMQWYKDKVDDGWTSQWFTKPLIKTLKLRQ